MGLALSAYFLLSVSGGWMILSRATSVSRPAWLRPLHIGLGISLVALVLLLLAIGIVGTLGEYGTLGHSIHLAAGLSVVSLVLVSAWSASQMHPDRLWARPLHLGTNAVLFLALLVVTATGWSVVQKYLP